MYETMPESKRTRIEGLLNACDFNGNDQVEPCELFECEIVAENIWRG
jgi:hypothetical protein